MNRDTPQENRRKRRLLGRAWAIVRLPAVAYLVVLVIAMIFEESLVFIPSRYPSGDWQPPGFKFQDARFTADDGTRLHGWYVEHPQPTAYVLFCHGNAGNITHRVPMVALLRDVAGASVLVFDYRGFGRSEGRPHEAGVLADARAARAWLAKRAGIDERQVVLLGESIGGGVAVDLAAADGARGLILESSFTSLPDAAAAHFPWLPVRWLMRTRLDCLSKIGRYHGPLLQSHGNPDSIVPYALGRRLFDAANEPKRFVELPGVDHNDLRPVSYYREVRSFLESLKK